MKTLSKIMTVGSILGGLFLVACGNNNSNQITCPAGEINSNNVCIASGVAGVGVGGACAAGQIQTSAGCGPECSYGGNQIGGLVNGNQCLPAIAGGYGVGSPYGYGGVGSPYGYGGVNPYTSNPCISIPGTYPVLIGGQMMCQPSYSGYTGGYYGGGYNYYYYR